MADESTVKTWSRRMAESLAEEMNRSEAEVKVEALELALDVAGELKAVRLKVLLAQSYAIIHTSRQSDNAAICEDDFLKDVLRELG